MVNTAVTLFYMLHQTFICMVNTAVTLFYMLHQTFICMVNTAVTLFYMLHCSTCYIRYLLCMVSICVTLFYNSYQQFYSDVVNVCYKVLKPYEDIYPGNYVLALKRPSDLITMLAEIAFSVKQLLGVLCTLKHTNYRERTTC